jgi:hypothetical protein
MEEAKDQKLQRKRTGTKVDQKDQKDEMDDKGERVKTILNQVRGRGGVPLSDSHIAQLLKSYKTLEKRGGTSPALVADPDALRKTFRDCFPNPHSRGQYARTFLTVLSGLTDIDFAEEYPRCERADLVRVLRGISTEANRDLKELKALGTTRGNAANADPSENVFCS